MFQSLQRYKSLYSKARLVNRNSSSISNALNINNVDLQYHCFPSFSLMFIGNINNDTIYINIIYIY